MKKLLFVLGFAMFVSGVSYGANPTVIEGGETASYNKITVSSTVATSLSAYSSSRLELTCVNTSVTQIYLTTAAVTLGGTATSFEVGPATSTYNTYTTRGREQVFGVLNPGAAGTGVMYCVEHR